MSPVESLHGLSQDMGGRMPEDVLAAIGIEFYEFQFARSLQWTIQVPQRGAIQTSGNHRIGQPLADTTCNLLWVVKRDRARERDADKDQEFRYEIHMHSDFYCVRQIVVGDAGMAG